MIDKKWTHYVVGKHFLDSGMLHDFGKEEIEIKDAINVGNFVFDLTLLRNGGKKRRDRKHFNLV